MLNLHGKNFNRSLSYVYDRNCSEMIQFFSRTSMEEKSLETSSNKSSSYSYNGHLSVICKRYE